MSRRAAIAGVGLTAFGRHEGSTALSLMAEAADAALADAGVERGAIDGLITGYATTMPHLMFADRFAEHYGMRPRRAYAINSGGATGAAMVALAAHLIAGGTGERYLVVAGENRLSGQSRDQSIQTLANVGHPLLEVPTGATVPAYYALMAARYLHDTGATREDLAALAVLMRTHAAAHPGAHLAAPITVADVLASRPIATPLTMLDCCPISDGGCAFVVAAGTSDRSIAITGIGEGRTHQHLSAAPDDPAEAATATAAAALAESGLGRDQIGYLGIYDSFTSTLAALLEATGFAPRGRAGRWAAEGAFGRDGRHPLNLHGGLLSYGHCGVGGGMALIAEAVTQLRGEAGPRQAATPASAFIHADGGVLSAHVSLVIER